MRLVRERRGRNEPLAHDLISPYKYSSRILGELHRLELCFQNRYIITLKFLNESLVIYMGDLKSPAILGLISDRLTVSYWWGEYIFLFSRGGGGMKSASDAIIKDALET